MDRDLETDAVTTRYPTADISPSEFERFVAELFESTAPIVRDQTVTLHEKVTGADGTYDFDATVRFNLQGMDFLVIVEAKLHKNPIKRELVQVLHAKLRSVGAQKAAMISTAPYQRGALEYAKSHGIALATVTEGRFTFETKSVDAPPRLSREQAAGRFGLPTFVGHVYSQGSEPSSTSVAVLSTRHPQYIVERLFGVAIDGGAER